MFSVLSNIHIDLQSVNTLSVFIRLLLATFFGGIIGLEREKKNRPAGFRTHILVCVGSALVMLTNQYAFETYMVGDPTRLGAQVISGIGFLGAGTILVTRQFRVRGLTTAAGLWASACIGLAVGIGFYSGAIIGGTFIFLVITILQRFDHYHIEKISHITLILEIENIGALKNIISLLCENDIRIRDIREDSSAEAKNSESLTVHMTIIASKKLLPEEILVPLRLIDGVKSVQRA